MTSDATGHDRAETSRRAKIVNPCPRCRIPMVAFELDGIEVDHCVQCRGTWLDSGELEFIAEQAGMSAGPLAEALASRGARVDARCPRCRRRLHVTPVGASSDALEIDACSNECGLWFDRGELLQFLERFDDGDAGAVARWFRELYRSELSDASSD